MGIKGFLRKIRRGKPIIIVSGLPRSGTSMIMKMLDAAEIEIASDNIRTADDDNPKGYFELERVKELDKNKDKSWLTELRGKAVKIISYFLPNLPYKNGYKVIFIERNLQEVIASQNKMLVNRGKEPDTSGDGKMILRFEGHLQKIKTMLQHDDRFDVLYIKHHDVLNDPLAQAIKINRFLGGRLDEEKMAMAVDPDLYRNRK